MLLIISAFIEFILCCLIFAFIPKKSHYETDYLVTQYRIHYQMHHAYYNSSYCDYFVENLKTSKEISIIILCLSILLLLFVFSRIIVAIYNKCKDNAISAIKFIKASVIIGFIIVIGNISLLGFIVYKIYKLEKDSQDDVGVAKELLFDNIKVIPILIADLILNIIQMCVAFKKYKIKDTQTQPYFTPAVKVIQPNTNNKNNNNNYPEYIVTTRSNIILVRKEKKYVTALRRVLPDDVFPHLDEYIEKGKLMMAKLVKYLFDMQFEGLTEIKVIQSELTDILARLMYLLKNMKDQIAIICEKNEDKEEAPLDFLIQYLFPLIVKVIRLRIQNGKYKNSQRPKSEQITILNLLEKTIDLDENGNVTNGYRINRQVVESDLTYAIV